VTTTRQHLIESHTREGEHLVACAKFHKGMAKCFSKLAALSKADKSEMHNGGERVGLCETIESIRDAYAEMADECTDKAAFHADCAKSLSQTSKAAGMSDDNWPSGLSGVTPEAPLNVRPVLRFGQRELSESPVPAELVKVFGDED
jgi:hypothetical protein